MNLSKILILITLFYISATDHRVVLAAGEDCEGNCGNSPGAEGRDSTIEEMSKFAAGLSEEEKKKKREEQIRNDKRAFKWGCSQVIGGDTEFKKIKSKINKISSLYRFMNNGKCEISDSDISPAPPIQVMLSGIDRRGAMLNDFITGLANLEDKSILPTILNRSDENGRSMLDYLEDVSSKTSSEKLKNTFSEIRERMCFYGGKYYEHKELNNSCSEKTHHDYIIRV